MSVKDIKAQVINNIFSQEDFHSLVLIPKKLIHKNLAAGKPKYDKFAIGTNGMHTLHMPQLDNNRTIYNNLIKTLSDKLGFKLTGAHGFYARYSNESGSLPNLPPHHDTAGEGYPTLTLSVQLGSNIDWPIRIYDEEFNLKDNDALVFCGTNNIHWRPDYDFKDGDYVDIFVCHLFFDTSTEDRLPENHLDHMMKQTDVYKEKYRKLVDLGSKVTVDVINNQYTNFPTMTIDNVFTQDQIDRIYKERFEDATTKKMQDGSPFVFADESCGYITSVYPLPKDVQETILQVMQKRSFFLIDKVESHFPRYTLDSGSNPQLKPHYDRGLEYASLTLSIQLKTTLEWPVCVGKDDYNIKENQAIMFSGSHQLHWRPDITFKEDDYHDIIVCQVHNAESPLHITDKHRDLMLEKAKNF